jgi:hypothetical protein
VLGFVGKQLELGFGKPIETLARKSEDSGGEFMLDIPSTFTYHTPPVPQDSDVAWHVKKTRNMLR